MANELPLLQLIQMIHRNNHVHTTNEGHIESADLDRFTLLDIGWHTNINPGLYRVELDGTQYAFALHDAIVGVDRLIINNANDIMEMVNGEVKRIASYKLNIGDIEVDDGVYTLNNSVNDYISILVIDGKSKFDNISALSRDIDAPQELNAPSMFSVNTENENGEKEEFVIVMKNYLKSLNDENDIKDILILDAANYKATFIFKVGRIAISGNEPWQKINEYSSDDVSVYYYNNPMIKLGSPINCTHFESISWDDLTDTNVLKDGICAGITEETQGIFIKVLNRKIKIKDENDVDAYNLIPFLREWYTLKEREYNNDNSLKSLPMELEFALVSTDYRTITLDSYKINTYFNKTYISINLYRNSKAILPREFINEIVAVVPKDGIIKSVDQQEIESGNPAYYNKILDENIILGGTNNTGLEIDEDLSLIKIMYFYKHFKIS